MRNLERSECCFRVGSKVKWAGDNLSFYGEVTDLSEHDCKVIFVGASRFSSTWTPKHTYYPKGDLTILSEEDYQEAVRRE